MKDSRTGHEIIRDFQIQKKFIRAFAVDIKCEVKETASTLILEVKNKAIEMIPKKKEYVDLSTGITHKYYNERACLMKFFNFYLIH